MSISTVEVDSNPSLDHDEIRKKIITVRKETPTRGAIQLVVRQRVNEHREPTLPTISVIGVVPTYVESYEFARDYGISWIVAYFTAWEWSLYVNSAKR